MNISKKYKPLFDIPHARGNAHESEYWRALSEVDTVVITGGRDSAKSFTTSLALCDFTVNHNHRVLYTRYTLTSAKDSIIPDFTEKISLLNYDEYFHITNDRIISRHNESKIVFKGIKTSSGNQTASLKSLKDFSCFVCEEAEEYPSFDDWEKIQLSIRATDVQALNVLILNPTTKKHWVYTNFFQDKGVTDGFNGVKDNILYIHTTYLDVEKEHIAPKNFRKYEMARKIHEKLDALTKHERDLCERSELKLYSYYKHVVLGGWLSTAEGIIYDDWVTFTDWPDDYDLRIFGLDFGFSNDPAAFVECVLKDNQLYVKEHIYQTRLLNRELSERIKIALPKNQDECYIVADSASPKDIAELNAMGLYCMPCVKGAGSIINGIKKVKEMEMFIHKDSINLQDELNHYRTTEISNARGETVTHIVKSDDHLLDAVRYAATRYR